MGIVKYKYPFHSLHKSIQYSVALLLLVFVGQVRSEHLPIKAITTANGLAHNSVLGIVRDSRGFLWFCTKNGLSRFDGNAFVNYGIEDGLPNEFINHLLETVGGNLWIATNGGGVARFNPASQTQTNLPGKFMVYHIGNLPATNRVNVLYQDRARRIWAGTDNGMFVFDESSPEAEFQPVSLNLPAHTAELVQVWSFLEDSEGSLWIGTKFGLLRRLPDNRMVHYAVHPSAISDNIFALIEDSEKRLWMGHDTGLVVFKPCSLGVSDCQLNTEGQLKLSTVPAISLPVLSKPQPVLLPALVGEAYHFDFNNKRVRSLLSTSDGTVWMSGLEIGLVEFRNGHLRRYTTVQGLTDNTTQGIADDLEGGIWTGTPLGAMRLAPTKILNYATADHLGQFVGSIFENRAGELCVTTNDFQISRFDREQFVTTKVNLPPTITGWRVAAYHIEDHNGEWWIGTRQGLYRFPKVSRLEELAQARPKTIYTVKEGLPDNDISRLFEDSRGDIWISTFAPGREVVTRWERATETFHRYSDSDGLRPFIASTVYREDRFGNLWIGFWGGGLARYRDGRFKLFSETDGLPTAEVKSLYLDHQGSLWIGTARGLCRIADLQSEQPHIQTYSTTDGLASNLIFCVTGDNQGRIYIGNSRGIDWLDTRTETIRHYAADDGLLITEFTSAFCDRSNTLWFGTLSGLLRLDSQASKPPLAPPVFIGGLKVAGDRKSLFEFGETDIAYFESGANQNQVQIDFFGLDFGAGSALRYQYKLEGLDSDWNAPTTQRAANYASLAPGSYRFMVRAVSANGGISQSPAVMSFRILPPIWRRWWFILSLVLLVGLSVYAFDRYRIARLLELERIRTRIATDLHDDIGSSLSQVSVLSEVIRHRLGHDVSVTEPLTMIAGLSRDLVDSMNDIVWAINPARDHLSDLTHRMRRFASDVFTARDLQFNFHAPDEANDIKVGADVRREVFLIFKEGINNMVRHSGCTQANINFAITHGEIELVLSDNGKGFDPDKARDGNGVSSMRQRTERLGGRLTITSNQQGTTIRLTAPVSKPWSQNGFRKMKR